MLRIAHWLAGPALALSFIGCSGTGRTAEESPPMALLPPQVRVEKDPDAHGNPAMGLHLFALKITAPPGYSITSIYRFYREGELDERQSRAHRTWGANGADETLMLGVLDPDATRPEPSSMIRIIGPSYTPRNSWFEVGDTKDISLSSAFGEVGPIGREVVLGELVINQPMRKLGDTATDNLRHQAPIWVTASYRVDLMTEEQHGELTGTSSVGEAVRVRDLPPIKP